jgi:hypothetical protein
MNKCGCDGDIPDNPLLCDDCNTPLCLRCSIDEYTFCPNCRKNQEEMIGAIEEKHTPKPMPECEITGCSRKSIVNTECGWKNCKTRVIRCSEHMNKCRGDLDDDFVPCRPIPRCLYHEKYCQCYFRCRRCSNQSFAKCAICHCNVCEVCSVNTSRVSCQRMPDMLACKIHGVTCGICGHHTFDVKQTECEHIDIQYDEQGLPVFQKCGLGICTMKHQLVAPDTTLAVEHFSEKSKLQFAISIDSRNFCSSHIIKCGILDCVPTPIKERINYDAIQITIGCCLLTAKVHSREVYFRTNKHRFDFCFECFRKIQEVFNALILLRRQHFPQLDKFILEKIFLLTYPITTTYKPIRAYM